MGRTPGQGRQRFPGFDVTGQAHRWDAETVKVVESRLAPHGPLKFFSDEEAPTAAALLDRLLAQDEEPRVPVFESVDERLAAGRGDGYRYEDMPEDGEAWRRSLPALDADARAAEGRPFADLDAAEQLSVLDAVKSVDGQWHGMPAGRLFSLWLRYACDAFYAHPWAWNEIGFGGPAYPRGYKTIGPGNREPYEVAPVDEDDDGGQGS